MTDGTTSRGEPVAVPCKIYVSFRNEHFDVTDIGAWQYLDDGVFASGNWNSAQFDRTTYTKDDVMIPYDKINFIKFDWDALERFQAEQPEVVEPENTDQAYPHSYGVTYQHGPDATPPVPSWLKGHV